MSIESVLEGLGGLRKGREDSREAAVAALTLIVSRLRRSPDTGQGRRLVAFLAGLYHGERFPFDMTELRGLDWDLSEACLAVLAYDRCGVAEIHKWGVVTADELNKWFQEAGLYYRAQQRRIGRDLYLSQFGEDGHPDEGLGA